jgi:hypothetical protein
MVTALGSAIVTEYTGYSTGTTINVDLHLSADAVFNIALIEVGDTPLSSTNAAPDSAAPVRIGTMPPR